MAIQNLTQGTPTSASQIPFYDPTNGQDRRCSATDLASVITDSITSSVMVTQYAAPAATGFTVTLSPPTDGDSVFLLLTPIAGYAAGTITLPAQATLSDGQEVLVHTTQSVTTLTVGANGATAVLGAPTTMAQYAFFRLRYDAVNKTWYRVG
jgi:hypothetical protein